jgi:diacylglycerol kinase family enzyme
VTGAHVRPSTRRRVGATIALAAAALLAIVVVVLVASNLPAVVIALTGALIAIVSGWWVLTERMPRRGVGVAGLGVAAALIVVGLLAAGDDGEQVVVRLGIAAGLLAVAFGAARVALTEDLAEIARRESRRSTPRRHPVLICNPWSGGGKVEQFGLIDLASSLGIETVLLDRGLDLEQLARDAVARGADCLGMAGGDGSQALVASIAVESAIPFVCVSAGTRNHFALDLGLDRDDPCAGVRAYRDAIDRRVDFATVNGRLFVNNVSLGVYATIVHQEGYREAKSATARGALPDLIGRTAEPFDLQFTTPDGTEVDGAFLIMVSNNPYVLGAASDVSQRRRLNSGQLGVFAVRAETGGQAAAALTRVLAGRRIGVGQVFQFTAEAFEVRSRSGTAFAGIDGETLELATPLRFQVHPRGLHLLVPEGNLEIALRREAREARAVDLLDIARGVRPGPSPTT